MRVRQRLDYLFDSDTAARWRIIGTTAVLIAICGFVLSLADTPLATAQLDATLLGVIVFAGQVFFQIKEPRKSVEQVPKLLPMRLARPFFSRRCLPLNSHRRFNDRSKNGSSSSQ